MTGLRWQLAGWILIGAFGVTTAGAQLLDPNPLVAGQSHIDEDHSSHDHSGVTLDDIDLTGASLSAGSLAFSSLLRANLSATDLSWADLTEALLDAAVVSQTDFTRAILDDASLVGVRGGCDPDVDCSSCTKFGQASLQGADLELAELACGFFEFAELAGARLDGVDLAGANLQSAVLDGVSAACVSEPELEPESEPMCAEFVGANLRWSSLIDVEMPRADFRNGALNTTDLADVDFFRANLAAAYFSNSEAEGIGDPSTGERPCDDGPGTSRAARLLRADISGANLSDAYLNQVDLGSAKGRCVQPRPGEEGSERCTNLSHAELIGACLDHARLPGVILTATNLSGADLTEATLGRVQQPCEVPAAPTEDPVCATVAGAMLIGLDVDTCDDPQAGRADLAGIDFSGLDLTDAILSCADFYKLEFVVPEEPGESFPQKYVASFRAARLVDADLLAANLTEVDFTDANLERANLENAVVAGANFEDAILIEADLNGLKTPCTPETDDDPETVKCVSFVDAQLMRADLRDADLSGAHLTGARISGADLSKATFAGADFSENATGGPGGCQPAPGVLPMDLHGVDLSGADLSGAANFHAGCISVGVSTIYDESTQFPDGFTLREWMSLPEPGAGSMQLLAVAAVVCLRARRRPQ